VRFEFLALIFGAKAMRNRSMKIAFGLIAMFFASIPATQVSATQMVALEDAQEANAADVMLPSTYVGTIYFKHCEKCNQIPLQLSDETKFQMGTLQVSFDEFKKAVETKHRIYTIFYKPATREVTRLKMN
jgi:hypothetical protein